jgi:hypothetical protein
MVSHWTLSALLALFIVELHLSWLVIFILGATQSSCPLAVWLAARHHMLIL